MAKILIYPANNNENQYINIQEKALKKIDLQVTYSLKDFFSTKYFLLNWFESLGGNVKLDYIKKCIKIFLFALFRKKVLWVVHNKQPHEKYPGDSSLKLSIKLMRKLLRVSTKIIILCDETYGILKNLSKNEKTYINKVYKIPHPNYINVYPDSEKKNKKEGLNFLCIGQVNKYKNIDLLIEVFNKIQDKNVSLVIAGNCKDKEFSRKLSNMITNTNIICDFRFIPDNQLIDFIESSDILVLPYSLDSSLNSGTIFLAFSYKKTVVSPLIGTLKEFKNDETIFYSYEYKNTAEHKQKLLAAIQNVIEDYSLDNKKIQQMGEKAYDMVLKDNSLEKITSLYKELFKEI